MYLGEKGSVSSGGDTQENGVLVGEEVPGLQESRGPHPQREVRLGSKVQGQFPGRRVLRGEQTLEPGEKSGGVA